MIGEIVLNLIIICVFLYCTIVPLYLIIELIFYYFTNTFIAIKIETYFHNRKFDREHK